MVLDGLAADCKHLSVDICSTSRPSSASFSVRLVDTEQTFRCNSGQTLLAAMERLGRRGIPVGCRGGGCGVCKVRIVEGAYRLLPMSRAHVSAEAQAAGQALACRLMPEGDLAVEVLGRFGQRLTASTPLATGGGESDIVDS